jgi:hypothetical protein
MFEDWSKGDAYENVGKYTQARFDAGSRQLFDYSVEMK